MRGTERAGLYWVAIATFTTPVAALCNTDEACRLLAVGMLAFLLTPVVGFTLALGACFRSIRRTMRWWARLLLLYAVFAIYAIATAMRWDLVVFPIGALAVAGLCWHVYERDRRGVPLCDVRVECIG